MDLDETWQVGLKPEKTKPCTFPAKSRYSFRRAREKLGGRGVVFFVTWATHHFCHFPSFLGSISAKLPTKMCPGGGSRHMVSHSRKVSNNGSNLRKTLSLWHPICDQATGHGKRSAMPSLFPSHSGHPTDVPFLGDFCWGMYRFPAIHLPNCPYQQWRYLDGHTVAPPSERRDTTQ